MAPRFRFTPKSSRAKVLAISSALAVIVLAAGPADRARADDAEQDQRLAALEQRIADLERRLETMTSRRTAGSDEQRFSIFLSPGSGEAGGRGGGFSFKSSTQRGGH